MMDGTGSIWMMGSMAVSWILIIVGLVLVIAALVKYLRA